jgi:ATP-dependent 26S proteasome regulatory subunit
MLFTKIKLGLPNLWVVTQDTFRILNQISSDDSRNYFTIDIKNGLSQYKDGQFKPYAIVNPNYNEEGPDDRPLVVPFDPVLCLEHLSGLEGLNTLIFLGFYDNSDLVNGISPYLMSSKKKYYDLFWSNDINNSPLQIVFISDSPPNESHSYFFNVVEDSYPSLEELSSVISHISFSLPLSDEVISETVKAGLGLSESDFIELCLTSIVQNKTIDPKFIYDQKMSSIKKNGILEIIKPSITFEDIGGLDNIKDIVRRTVKIWQNKEYSDKMGIKPIRRILMIGIPGTGKSAICQATANELNLDLARTGISQVMNSFIGQSEKNMRSVFSQIKAMSPLCVWIDEFGRDMSGGSSSSHVDGGTTDRVHGEFLTGLQELPEETFLMCAANSLDALRPEMLRADRFDKILFVGLPSHSERQHIFNIYLSKIDTDHNFDLEALSIASQYMTGAEIASLVQETKFFVTGNEFRPITTNDILHYIPRMKNTIWLKHKDMVVSMYKTALEQWDWASQEQFDEAYAIIDQTNISASSTDKNAVKKYAWK